MIPSTETVRQPLLLDPTGPSVVALGGGHGLAAALEAIQLYAGEVTAVVSMADDGGSSGRLTAGLGIPAPGDIRRCLLALTPEPSMWSELFAHRFHTGDIADHSLGNLMLAALTELYGDFGSAVEAAARMLETVGAVVPATLQPTHLRARVGGRLVEGQAAVTAARGGVERVELVPDGLSANPRAMEAIAEADQIVVGPGSLFTSLVAALRVPGMAGAVGSGRGQIVFVLNLVTQDGETLGLDGMAHLQALVSQAEIARSGVVLVHDGDLEVPPGVERVALTDSMVDGWAVVRSDLADPMPDWPAHDPVALGQALEGLLKE